ncbi:MAG: hypothetical protein KAR35_08125 [Candidatus Heimdallarchaeota archaeon]|nr:hypothetical protein [Candidatus Heimdallarchaeota archaeon]MCK5049326.1 hypothetical protein [Candidatus Heimdallarchaeota archaeon]
MVYGVSNDLLHELEEIQEILDKSHKRALSPLQISIIISSRLDAIKQHYNVLVAHETLPVEEITRVLNESLAAITFILNSQTDQAKEVIWYELDMMRITFASSLTTFLGEGGALRIRGTAQTLVNILMGIDAVDVNPILVDHTHPDYITRLSLAFNILSSTGMVFLSALSSLHLIYYEHLDEWSKRSMISYIHIVSLIRKTWDVKILYDDYKRRRSPNAFNFFAVSCYEITNFIAFISTIHGMYANDWPEIFSNMDIIDTTDDETILSSIEKLFQEVRGMMKDLEDHEKKGTFERNDTLQGNEQIQFLYFFMDIVQLEIELGRAVFNYINNKETDEELDNVMTKIIAHLEGEQEDLTDPDFLLKSTGDNSTSEFTEFLFFTYIHAIRKDDLSVIYKIKELMGQFFSEKGEERFPQLTTVYYAVLLSAASRIKDRDVIKKAATRLLELSPKLLYETRDSFNYFIMGHLALVSIGEEDKESFLKAVRDDLSSRIEYGLTPSLIVEAEEYFSALEEALEGHEPEYSLKRVSNPVYYDIASIMIPDFEGFARKQGYGQILFLPFNLSTDTVFRDDPERYQQPL